MVSIELQNAVQLIQKITIVYHIADIDYCTCILSYDWNKYDVNIKICLFSKVLFRFCSTKADYIAAVREFPGSTLLHA